MSVWKGVQYLRCSCRNIGAQQARFDMHVRYSLRSCRFSCQLAAVLSSRNSGELSSLGGSLVLLMPPRWWKRDSGVTCPAKDCHSYVVLAVTCSNTTNCTEAYLQVCSTRSDILASAARTARAPGLPNLQRQVTTLDTSRSC
jgi:hypothetical protein